MTLRAAECFFRAADRELVHFDVRDDGPGIALDEQGRIFERFAQGSARNGRARGTGLGLAIVRAVAEAHGGHAELVQAGPPAVEFTLRLPAAFRSPGEQLREVVSGAREELIQLGRDEPRKPQQSQ